MNKNPHIGSSFDDFLKEEGIFDEVNAVAIKRVISWQVQQEMESKQWTKKVLAERMDTSRSAVDRMLDPENTSVTLKTLDRTASVLGKRLKIELVDA